MNNHIRDIHGLELEIQHSDDVSEPKKFFDGRKYSCDPVLRMVCCILNYVLALERCVRNQLTVVVLEASRYVCHCVVDGVYCTIAGIREIRLLNHGNNLLHKRLLNSLHFLK